MQETKNYKKLFYDKYLELVFKMTEIEPKRKELLFKLKTKLFVISLIVIVFVTSIILSGFNFRFLIFTFGLMWLALIWIIFKPSVFIIEKQEFKNIIKGRFFSKLITCFDYMQKGTENVLENLRLNTQVAQINIREDEAGTTVDDNFYGNYKGLDFKIIEIKRCLMRGQNGVFGDWNGVVFEIKLLKKLKAPVYIIPKSDKSHIIMIVVGIVMTILFSIPLVLSILFNMLPFIQNTQFAPIIFAPLLPLLLTVGVIISLIHSKFEKAKLEDINFEKNYVVETTDQVEARYLLTTSFIDRLNNLKTAFNSKDIRIFAENDTIIFAIATNKDLFEIGDIYHPITDGKQIEQFYNEITVITDMIDHFKLDERTGL